MPLKEGDQMMTISGNNDNNDNDNKMGCSFSSCKYFELNFQKKRRQEVYDQGKCIIQQ